MKRSNVGKTWNFLVRSEGRRRGRLREEARAEGRLRMGPTESGYPVGYWALLSDPDGHTLELSFGQEVWLAVESAI